LDYDALVKFVQEHFTDGLALVIGSGLSAAEGLPGMAALATHHSNGMGDHARSCMGSCRDITTRAKTTVLDHFPRAIVLKPHGSFDWYQSGNDARRCGLDLDAERLMITPGINKYRAGYNSPFDKHRGRLLVVGYGFNDDHLQTHLVKQIQDGTPTLILNRSASSKVEKLSEESPRCFCLSKPTSWTGVAMVTKGHRFEHEGHDLWDLGVLTKELLT
jgi:hypothetical protein